MLVKGSPEENRIPSTRHLTSFKILRAFSFANKLFQFQKYYHSFVLICLVWFESYINRVSYIPIFLGVTPQAVWQSHDWDLVTHTRWLNVDPTSVLSSRRWANVNPTYILLSDWLGCEEPNGWRTQPSQHTTEPLGHVQLGGVLLGCVQFG